eukprot:3632480-Rhodomonas_salina.1
MARADLGLVQLEEAGVDKLELGLIRAAHERAVGRLREELHQHALHHQLRRLLHMLIFVDARQGIRERAACGGTGTRRSWSWCGGYAGAASRQHHARWGERKATEHASREAKGALGSALLRACGG